MAKKFTVKKIILMSLSFLISVACALTLIYFVQYYNSHKIYKIFDFPSHASLENGIILSDGVAFSFNEYGSDFIGSELYSTSLLQYNGPDEDFDYYKFNNVYFGVDDSSSFSPANSSDSFFFKNDNDLFYINIAEKTCNVVNEGKNITSCSLAGTYFIEEAFGEYIFYNFDKYSRKFINPVTLMIDPNSSFCCWLNDSYALFSSETDKGLAYFIGNAQNGEALICASINESSKNYQKYIISNRFLIKEIEKEEIIFDIYTQEPIDFDLRKINLEDLKKISNDGHYLITSSGANYKIFSQKGNELSLNDFVDDTIVSVDFLCDNVIIVTTSTSSSAYKIII